MAFQIDPIYLIWLSVAISAGLAAEAVYLLGFSTASYRSRINRRLMLSKEEKSREAVLIELRRERGLTAAGNYRLGLVALNRLILQSGVTIGLSRILVIVVVAAVMVFVAVLVFRDSVMEAAARPRC